MRRLKAKERKKRGCVDCADVRIKNEKECNIYKCIHSECPYHELDKYDTYDDYLQSEDSRLPLDKLFGL